MGTIIKEKVAIMVTIRGGVTMPDFIDIIISERKSKGMTQEQLGLMLHVSKQTISRWENRARRLPLEKLLEAANALDLPLESLLHATTTQQN